MALIVLLVPVSCTGTQSQAVAEQLVFHPLPWLSQMNSPPVTQWLMLVTSAPNGAMKRGSGSQGFGVKTGLKQDGLIVAKACVLPFDTPPLTVEIIFRATYSVTALLPLAGSTRTSPPSPPCGETMLLAPGRSRLTPLSCRPPQMSTPPCLARPTPTE